jgi:antitoxin ParD1/3/4
MRASKPLTVTLGRLQSRVDERLASGEFESASEVLRAGLRALDREDQALEEILKAKVRESLEDDEPPVPAEEVFAALRAKARARLNGG